jgi:hypothetical protein
MMSSYLCLSAGSVGVNVWKSLTLYSGAGTVEFDPNSASHVAYGPAQIPVWTRPQIPSRSVSNFLSIFHNVL